MDFKLFLHNTKDNEYKVAGLTIKKIDDYFNLKINDISVNLPINKFENIIKNMHGSINFKNEYFKLKKDSKEDMDIKATIKDINNVIATTSIPSTHYNSVEHVQLIKHFENNQNYISLGINDVGSEISIEITNEGNLLSEKNYVNERYFQTFELDKTKNIETLKTILNYIIEKTTNNIMCHNIDYTLSKINFSKDYSRFIDLEDFGIKREDYTMLLNSNEDENSIYENSQQRAVDLNKFHYFPNNREELIKLIKREKDKLNENNVILHKIGENKYIPVNFFEKKNEQKILNFVDKLEFNDNSIQNINLIKSIFYYANISRLNKISNLILDKFEDLKKSNENITFSLDFNYRNLSTLLYKDDHELTKRVINLTEPKQFELLDTNNFITIISDRNLLKDAILNSSLDKTLLRELINVVGLEDILEEFNMENRNNIDFNN